MVAPDAVDADELQLLVATGLIVEVDTESDATIFSATGASRSEIRQWGNVVANTHMVDADSEI